MATHCVPVFFSHPGRRAILEKTIQLFWERDKIRGNDVATIWDGHDIPDGPPGQNKDVTDFRALIHSPILDGKDLLFLEDDIEPCINALSYMMQWDSPYIMTSFYNPGPSSGRKYGANRGFIFSQAFKLSRDAIEVMRREEFPPPHPKLQRDGIDQVVHRYLERWRLPFWQHRSVVEHTGEVSTWNSKLTLRGAGRKSIDWPGPTVDALTFKWTGGR